MSRLSARAEWIKLCQFLNVPADEFAFLTDLPSAELRSARVALQEQWVAVARALRAIGALAALVADCGAGFFCAALVGRGSGGADCQRIAQCARGGGGTATAG